MDPAASSLPLWWAQVLSTTCLRTLPCALYLVLGGPLRPLARLGVAVAFVWLLGAALAAGAHPIADLLLPALGLAYFLVLAVVVWGVARAFAGAPPSKLVLLGLLAFAFIAVPAVAIPYPASITVQLLGWEMTFAAYSYCLDGAKPGRAASFGECAFFLLINPTVVFPERGQRIGPPALRPAALLRCIAGVGALALHNVLYDAAYFEPAFSVVPLYAIVSVQGYLRFVIHYALRLVGGYAGHAGLASLQIGLVRLLGHEVPERFHYPLLATGPVDFWRRWNRYTGAWARRYLFAPLSLWLRRRARRVPAPLLTALAALATFLAIGAAHDFSLVVRIRELGHVGGTLVFALHGLLLIAWLGASRLLSRSRTARAVGAGRPAALLRWVLFSHALLLTVWLAVPGMSGEGLAMPAAELALLLGRRAWR